MRPATYAAELVLVVGLPSVVVNAAVARMVAARWVSTEPGGRPVRARLLPTRLGLDVLGRYSGAAALRDRVRGELGRVRELARAVRREAGRPAPPPPGPAAARPAVPPAVGPCLACAEHHHGRCSAYLARLGIGSGVCRCPVLCHPVADAPQLSRAALDDMATHGTLVGYVLGQQSLETSSLSWHYGRPCPVCAARRVDRVGVQESLI